MLSTKNLFHYTHKESLKGILKEGFRFGVVQEDLPIIYEGSEDPLLLIPDLMLHQVEWKIISFCDIPIDRISDHQKQYGQLAIGLTKSWAQINHISPVRYVHHYTPFNMELFRMARDSIRMSAGNPLPLIIKSLKDQEKIPVDYNLSPLNSLDSASKAIIKELLNVIWDTWVQLYKSGAYLRRYEGIWKDRSSEENESTRIFYDEKEWRAATFEDNPPNLTFSWNDISHIIVNSEEEKSEISQHVKEHCEYLKIQTSDDIQKKIRLLPECFDA